MPRSRTENTKDVFEIDVPKSKELYFMSKPKLNIKFCFFSDKWNFFEEEYLILIPFLKQISITFLLSKTNLSSLALNFICVFTTDYYSIFYR